MSNTITVNKIDFNQEFGPDFLIINAFNDELLIFKHEKIFHVVSSFCPHFGGPVSYEKNTLKCYWHGWEFSPTTYRCINRKVNCKLREYKYFETDLTLEILNESKI